MTHANFRCTVNAPFETLWRILMDEVENPHQYNQGINAAEVIERFHDGILRKVAVPDADVRERVVFNYDKGEITSTIVGHPQLVGEIRKTVKGSKSGPLTLESVLEWKSTDEGINQMLRRNVEAFIMSGLDQVKAQAEREATL